MRQPRILCILSDQPHEYRSPDFFAPGANNVVSSCPQMHSAYFRQYLGLTPEQTQHFISSGFIENLQELSAELPSRSHLLCMLRPGIPELHPTKYEELVSVSEKSGVKAYLVNTGWNETENLSPSVIPEVESSMQS